MNPNRRLFWPIIITTLAVVCLHPFVFREHVLYRDQAVSASGADLVLVAFGLALLLLASLRARWGTRLSDGAALLLCGVPFLTGLILGSEPPPLAPSDGPWAAYDLWVLVELRALGAVYTLGLLVAELVLSCRFTTGRASGRPIFHGLLLALPFQLGLMVQLNRPDIEVWELNLLVPGLALVLLPLSLVRGGARTARLVVGLALAVFLVSAIDVPELVRASLGPHGCGPASDLERLRFAQEDLFGAAFLEGFTWAPGLLALSATVFTLRKQKVLLTLAVVTLFIGLDALAISRLSRLHDVLSDSRRGDEFVPRGRGARVARALRLSHFVLLGADGALLLRNPLADAESLGKALGAHALEEDACWLSCDARLPCLTLELDARLSETQELMIARVARSHGVAAIQFVEGEDRAEPGSPFVLSTHVARMAAGIRQATFFLGRDAVPSACKPGGLRTTTSLEGARWTDAFVLESAPARE